MPLTALKQYKRTAFLSVALAASAAFTACGGGGGGGSEGGGLERKIAIVSPASGSKLIDASGKIQLDWLTGADKSSLQVLLNGVDVTAYFKEQGVGPAASIFVLQGLIEEGSNRLTVKVKDSTTEAIKFTADLSEPELIITDVQSGALDALVSGAIRKSTLKSVDYIFANGNPGSAVSVSGKSFTNHSILTSAIATNDTEADLHFTVVDNSTAISGGAGNTGELSLSFPGRTIQAALAAQMNNSAFEVLEDWVEEIAAAYIDGLDSDASPLLDKDASQEQGVCAQIGNGAGGQAIVNGAQNQYCQVFVSNLALGALTTDLAVMNEADSDEEFKVKAEVKVATTTASAVIEVFDKAAFDADGTLTVLNTITAPLTISNTALDIVFGVKKGASGSLDLHLEAIDAAPRASTAVSISTAIAPSAPGSCTSASPCNKPTIPQAAVQTVINEIFNPATIALSLDEQLRIALFCDMTEDAAGDDAVCDDGLEVSNAVNTTDYPIISAKVDVEEPINYESQQIATLTTNASASVVSKVGKNLSTAKGAFIQMAASAFTEEFVGNADFKDALGAYFVAQNPTSPIALQNLGTASSDDALVALPSNMINHALLSVFQSGVADKQEVSMKIGDIDPSLATAAINISAPVVFKTKAVGVYDDMVFNFELKSPPYLKFVEDGAAQFVELHVNALRVTANIEVPTNPFYSPIEKSECTAVGVPYLDCINISGGFGDGVGAADGGALDMEVDLIARLELSLNAEKLPALAIDSSDISVSFGHFDNYVTRKLDEAKNKGLCSNLAQLVSGFNCSSISFERGDIVTQIPSLLDPILDDLNTSLIESNTQTINVPALNLAENKRLEVILNEFGVDAINSSFVLRADVCDASISKTNLTGGCAAVHGAAAKGINTFIITSAP